MWHTNINTITTSRVMMSSFFLLGAAMVHGLGTGTVSRNELLVDLEREHGYD